MMTPPETPTDAPGPGPTLAPTLAPAPAPKSRVRPEIVAFVLSLLWLGGMVAAFRMMGDRGATITDTLGVIVAALAVFLPIALIWVAALVLRSARDMRDDARRLHATVEGMRRAWVQQQQAAGLALKPTVEEKLDEIAAAQRAAAEVQKARFTTSRTAPLRLGASMRAAAAPTQTADDAGAQPVLALENPVPPQQPVSPDDFIRALHFPENEHDADGFAALRRALNDHATAELIRAAQDVLTVLAEERIYMDDLRPDRARPEVWRAFAAGARGPEVSGLGGVRDRSCLALTYARMRSDTGFRESAHRFLRAFDLRFADFEPQASDDQIARLSETRSARAFMLLGRVTGMLG